MSVSTAKSAAPQLAKAPTGIDGFDQITGGGLPQGRPSLVCGSAGCGKTLFGLEFIIHGATQFNEPGVIMTFEETERDLTENVRSLGHDLEQLSADGKIMIDHVRVERSEIEEAGEYNLDGLFLRLGLAIDAICAKRVMLDTLEALFSGFTNEAILRAELRRLFLWLKDREVTTVITGERGDGALTRQGLEEYVSDCVVLLDHRVLDQVSTRRLRIVKYRGSAHGTNEYPFLIDEDGISVLPITSLSLKHQASEERISTGIARLDEMLGGGFYRGTSILISGTAGTGKSSLAAYMVEAACRRGERCLYFAFEEAPAQIVRNMRSIGLNLGQWTDNGLLQFHAQRPSLYGLEMHLAVMHKAIEDAKPSVVVIDPISNLSSGGTLGEAGAMLVRIIDFLKVKGITTLLTNLTSDASARESTDVGVSSLVDSWILLRDIELGGERNRGLYIIKSRGTAHSNQIREFLLTDKGIDLLDVYVGPEGVLTGSMRLAQEARERAVEVAKSQEDDRRARILDRKRKAIAAQIAALEAELSADETEAEEDAEKLSQRIARMAQDRHEMAVSRKADGNGISNKGMKVGDQG